MLTLLSLRGMLVVGFMAVWLKLQPAPVSHSGRQRWIALGIGLLFGGTMFGLMTAIALLPVSIAILAYFAYPVLTGVVGGFTGVDRLGWRALTIAFAAFLGLVPMLGAELDRLSGLGIVWALGAAGFRVASLLLARAYLHGTDARLTTWYSMLPFTGMFLLASWVVGEWHTPATWVATP